MKPLRDYIFIIIGCFIFSIGMDGFLIPNSIATGGTAGLAFVLNHLLSLSIGTWFVIINLPLLFLGFKLLGKRFVIKTVVTVLLLMFFIDFFKSYYHLPVLSNEPLLATLYGGIVIGLGLGLIFKGGASAGGSSVVAMILSKKTQLKTGTFLMLLDGFVIALTGWVFHNIEVALWSLISIYATSKVVDTILTGKQSEKIVHISSLKPLEELSKLINDKLSVSGTIVRGSDISLTEHKDIIFLVIENNRLTQLKQLVYQYDKNARMIVMDASMMLNPKH